MRAKEPPLAVSSKRLAEDLAVALCGLLTSLSTAVVLWWIGMRFGFAFYTYSLWLVIPVGALLTGFAGASGYYGGSTGRMVYSSDLEAYARKQPS